MNLSSEQKQVIRGIIDTVGTKPYVSLGGLAGTGKAQPLDAEIYTPYGPKKMGDIKIGDIISNPDGRGSRVIGVYPQGVKQIFKVKFIDGSETRVCGDHLWKAHISSKTYKTCLEEDLNSETYQLYTTNELRSFFERNKNSNRKRYPLIPFSKPVEFNFSYKINIDPYLIGIILSDGGISAGSICVTTKDEKILENIKKLILEDYTWVQPAEITYRLVKNKTGIGRDNFYVKELKKLDLWGLKSEDKFIPDCYKFSNIENRKLLIKGLMDGDGTVSKGNPSYCTTSLRLAKDIQWVIRSLGGKATITEKQGKYKKDGMVKFCKKAYNLTIQIENKKELFSLKRKMDKCYDDFNNGQSGLKNRMVSIEPCGEAECQCIQVSNINGLYLTDNFIVTHNTTIVRNLLEILKNWKACAYTGKAASVLRQKGVPASTIHSLIYKPVTDGDGNMVLDEYGNPQFSLVSDLEADGIIVDEASMISKDLFEDLLSYHLPIVFVGDHGQLEPIGEDINLMKNLDFKLETIHRNAGEIARFCDWIRKGYRPAAFQNSFEGKVHFLTRWQADKYLTQVDQSICAFNATRVQINRKTRAFLGKGNSDSPVVGDRVMCLRNNHKIGLYNGMQGEIKYLHPKKNRMHFKADEGSVYDLVFDAKNFNEEKYDLRGRRDDPDPFDYCYGITAHKSQGSEWDNVMVYEQKGSGWDHRRWCYTAASRAANKLYWVVL
jgi:hypothetical protein